MNQDEFEAKVKAIHERVLSKNSSAEEENTYTESLFESIKHINEYGQEVWYARELAKVLDYKDFRNFELIIFKAMEACRNSENEISDHFGEFTEMVPIGSNAKRGFRSYQISRYGCYLIVMNGDPQKEIIALGQTYFASKTRQQELLENYDELTDDQKRLAIRQELKDHNKSLADAAHDSGVINPWIMQYSKIKDIRVFMVDCQEKIYMPRNSSKKPRYPRLYGTRRIGRQFIPCHSNRS